MSILVDVGSATFAAYSSDPVVSLRFEASAPFRTLEMIGALQPAGEPTCGWVVCEVAILRLTLVGPTKIAVPLASYFAAEPDPLAEQAAGVLHHLEHGHSTGLLQCLHAHGMAEAAGVIPRTLDRYGLELAVLTDTGVVAVRLAFPGGPVSSLREVAAHLRVVLTCAGRGDCME